VRWRQRRTRSVHSCCVGCGIEPRNDEIAGAETVFTVERNMCNAAMRGIVVPPTAGGREVTRVPTATAASSSRYSAARWRGRLRRTRSSGSWDLRHSRRLSSDACYRLFLCVNYVTHSSQYPALHFGHLLAINFTGGAAWKTATWKMATFHTTI
jgi:hypothetical protein